MRKLIVALLVLTTLPFPASSEAAIKVGAQCTAPGKSTTIAKVSYTCSKIQSRWVWAPSIRVGVPCKNASITAVVLGKRYICVQVGKNRKWQLQKKEINKPQIQVINDSTKAPEGDQTQSISIIFDSISAANKIPVVIERVETSTEKTAKPFKYQITASTDFKTLSPGTYSITLTEDRIVGNQGINLGSISSNEVILASGESQTVTVNFETFIPKTTKAPEVVTYSEFKSLPNDGVAVASKELEQAGTVEGSYLILPASSELPNGYIGKVTSVLNSIYTVAPVSYLEAVPTGHISFSSKLNQEALGLTSDSTVGAPTVSILAWAAGKNMGGSVSKKFRNLSCTLAGGTEFSVTLEKPDLDADIELVWDHLIINKFTLGIRIGGEVKIQSNLKSIALSCQAKIESDKFPVPATPLFIQFAGGLGYTVTLEKAVKIAETTYALPVNLSGGVQYIRGDGWHKYEMRKPSRAQVTIPVVGEIKAFGSLSVELSVGAGSGPAIFVRTSPELGSTLRFSKVECEIKVELKTKVSISVSVGAEIDTPFDKLDVELTLFEKTLKEWTISTPQNYSIQISPLLCETKPPPDENTENQISGIPFGHRFNVQGSGLAFDYYINLSHEVPIYISGDVPQGTSVGLLTIFFVKNNAKIFVQNYEIGMGQHTHQFSPSTDGVYEFKLYFNKSSGVATPDSIMVSIFPSK